MSERDGTTNDNSEELDPLGTGRERPFSDRERAAIQDFFRKNLEEAPLPADKYGRRLDENDKYVQIDKDAWQQSFFLNIIPEVSEVRISRLQGFGFDEITINEFYLTDVFKKNKFVVPEEDFEDYIITVYEIPSGVTIVGGIYRGDGVWMISGFQLEGLKFIVAEGVENELSFKVTITNAKTGQVVVDQLELEVTLEEVIQNANQQEAIEEIIEDQQEQQAREDSFEESEDTEETEPVEDTTPITTVEEEEEEEQQEEIIEDPVVEDPPPPTPQPKEAQTPNLSLSQQFGTEDDSSISLNILASLNDTDAGDETLTAVISNVPTGGTLTHGTYIGGDSWSLTSSELSVVSLVPPANLAGDISLNVTVRSTESSSGSTATKSSSFVLSLTPVADGMSVSVSDFNLPENTATSLPVTAALIDTDGSETATITFDNVPNEISFSAGSNNGDGTWSFTAAELTGLNIIPDPGYSTDFALTVYTTTTEALNGDTATTTDTVNINLVPQADPANLSVTGAVAGNEDTAIGLTITSSLVDNDGSETLAILISGVPTGATLSAGTNNGDGTWSLTQAQLAGLTITPDTHDDTDFTLTISAISTETDGGHTATVTDTIDITVNPVSDGTTLTANNVSGNEDTAIALDITNTLIDTSETITSVVLSGLPAGAVLSAGSNEGGGTWTLQQADLAGLTFTSDTHDGTDFTVTVTVTTDDNGDTTTTTDTFNVTVTDIADAPTLTLTDTAAGNEDTAIALTINAPALVDSDGSETLSNITISGVPTGATLSAGTNNMDGTWTLTSAQLAGLTITPPSHDADEFTLTVSVTSTEGAGGDTATTTDTIAVTVNDVADAPTLTLTDTAAGNEDTAIALTINAPALVDSDGSETLSDITISGVPTGATLSAGSNEGGGVWTLTSAELVGLTITPATHDADEFTLTVSVTSTEGAGGDTATTTDTIDVTVNDVADAPTLTLTDTAAGNEDTAIALTINAPALVDSDGSETLSDITISGVPTGATLSAGSNEGGGVWTLTSAELVGLTITPPTHDADEFTLTVSVTSTEGTGGDTATTTDTIDVTVNDVADAPTLTLTDTAAGNEDTAIALTINAPALVDSDGSETLSDITISGVPTGATLSAGTNNMDGTWTLTSAQLVGLTITPPSHDADEFTLTVSVTSTEGTGGDTATTTDTIAVTVNDVADAPTLTLTDTAAGNEDTAIALTINAPALVDSDGSETLSDITISGVPTGATLSAGSNEGGGVWTLTSAELVGLTITPPSHDADEFTLTVSVTSTEGTGGDTATTTDTIAVTVNDIADAATVSIADVYGKENRAIDLNLDSQISLVDSDGSETMSIVLSGIPDDFKLSAGTKNGDGTWTLTSAQLANLFLVPPDDEEYNFTVTATVTTTEGSGGDTAVSTDTFDVSIFESADEAELSVVDIATKTDTAVDLQISVDLTDSDETVSILISGVPVGAELSNGSDNGDGTWTLTKDELVNLQLTPASADNSDFTLTVTATTTESDGTTNQVTDTIAVTVDTTNVPTDVQLYHQMSDNIVDSGNVFTHSITQLDNGNYLIVWLDGAPAVDLVRAQVRDQYGNDVGSEFVLDAPTDSNILEVEVTALTGGGFALYYTGRDGDANDSPYLRYFDNNGTATTSAIELFTGDSGFAEQANVVALDNGGVAVLYKTNGGTSYITTYDSSGTQVLADNELEVGVNEIYPDFDIMSNGNAVVVYRKGSALTTVEVNLTTGVLGTVYTLDASIPNERIEVTVLDGGNIVFAYRDDDNDLYIQIRSADNSTELLSATQITTGGLSVHDPYVLNLADGGFLLFWGQDGTPKGVYGQAFDADGTSRTGIITIDDSSSNAGLMPQALQLDNGNIAFVYADNTGNAVYDIILDKDTLTPAAIDNTSDFSGAIQDAGQLSFRSELVLLDNGNYLYVWFDNDGTDTIRGQIRDQYGNDVGAELDFGQPSDSSINAVGATALDGGGFALQYTARDGDTDDSPYVALYDNNGTLTQGPVEMATVDSQQFIEFAPVGLSGGGVLAHYKVQGGQESFIIYNSSLTEVVSATELDTSVTEEQARYELMEDGNVVAIYMASGVLYSRTIDSSTGALGTVQTITSSAATNAVFFYPGISILNNSNIAVAYRGSDDNLYMSIRSSDNSSEVLAPTQLQSGATEPYAMEIVALDSGGFIMAWGTNKPDGEEAIFIQKFNDSGSAVTGIIKLYDNNANDWGRPQVTELENGNIVVAQIDYSSGTDILQEIILDSVTLEPANLNVATRSEDIANTSDVRWGDLTTLSNGNYLVAWVNQDPAVDEIHYQLRSPDGNDIGSSFTLTPSDADINTVQVLGLSGGGFVMLYSARVGDTDDTPYIRFFDNAGSPTTAAIEFDVGADVSSNYDFELTELQNGNIAITYREQSEAGEIAVYNQAGTEVLAPVIIGAVLHKVAVMENGSLISLHRRSGADLEVEIIDPATGGTSGSITLAASADIDQNRMWDVEVLNGGNIVYTYSGSDDELHLIIRSADNSTELLADTVVTSGNGEEPHLPDIITLADGGFAIFWYARTAGEEGIYGRTFNADGTARGEVITIDNSIADTANYEVSAAQLANGSIVLSYGSSSDNVLYDIVLDPIDLQPVTTEFTIQNYAGDASGFDVGVLGATDADGGETFTYAIVNGDTDIFEITGGDTLSVKAAGVTDYYISDLHTVQISVTDSQGNVFYKNLTVYVEAPTFDPTGTIHGYGYTDDSLVGTSGNDTMYGFSGNDLIVGGDGTDTIYGMQDHDALYGGAGNDTLYGGTGNDVLYGGAGADNLYGGEGNDELHFSSGEGNDIAYGGEGTDTVMLHDLTGGPGVIAGAGTWSLTTGDSYTTSGDVITFDNPDASGTITYWDGTTLTFSGVEKINWDITAGSNTVTASNVTGNEDAAIALDISNSLADNDGSEAISSILISNVPTGATLSAGSNNGDNTWTLTPEELTGLTITPVSNSDADFTLTVTTTNIEISTGATNTATDTMDVTVTAVADAPTLTLTDTASGNEDTAIALTINAPALVDSDGSETLSDITISGVPTGATLSAGSNEGGGVWTLTSGELAGLTITPPSHDASEFTLTVSVTATETTGGDTAVTTDTIAVTVNDVADAPTLTLTDTASGNEDTAIALTINTPTLVDSDGSETLSDITISGVPIGATLSAGSNEGGGVWTLTSAQLVGLTLTPPTNDASEFTLTVSVTATETTGGDTAVTTDTIAVTVNDIADAPTVTVGSEVVGESQNPISLSISQALVDSDGSETLGSVLISGVPAGASLSAGTDNGNNTWSVDTADLVGLTITTAADESSFTLTVTSTATETTGGDTATTTDTITVSIIDQKPVGGTDVFAAPTQTATTFDVLANDFHYDGKTLSILNIEQPANGAVVNNGDGTITYTSNALYNGQETFSYWVTDGVNSDRVTVIVNVSDTAFTTATTFAITDAQYENQTSPGGSERASYIEITNTGGSAAELNGLKIGGVTQPFTFYNVNSSGVITSLTLAANSTIKIYSDGSFSIDDGTTTGQMANNVEFGFSGYSALTLSEPDDTVIDNSFIVNFNVRDSAPSLDTVDAVTRQDTAVELQIESAVTDADDSLVIIIEGVPSGASLSAGTLGTDGSWSLTPSQLSGLTLTPAAGSQADFTLTVKAISIDNAAGAAITTSTIDVTVGATNTPTDISFGMTDMTFPSMTLLSNGNYLMSWLDDSTTPNMVKAVIKDASGNVVKEEFGLTAASDSTIASPVVAAMPGGGFALAYTARVGDTNDSPYIQYFDNNGLSTNAAFEVGTNLDVNVSNDAQMDLVVLSDGTVVLAYVLEGSFGEIAAYDSDGNLVNTGDFRATQTDVLHPHVAEMSNGDVIISFTETDDNDVSIVTWDPGTNTFGTIFDVEAGTTEELQGNDVAVLTGGNIVTVFVDSSDLMFDIRNSDNTSTIADNTNVTNDNGTPHDPIVLPLADGGFALFWAEDSSSGVYGRLYDADGTARGSEVTITSSVATGTGIETQAVQLANGNIVLQIGDPTNNELYEVTLNSTDLSAEIALAAYTPAAAVIPEYDGAGGGFNVVTLGATDADGGETFTYAIAEGDTSIFEITGGNVLSIKAAGVVDYFISDAHPVTISATDSQGNVYYETITVNVAPPAVPSSGIVGSNTAEAISGGNTADTIYGYAGDDEINARGGADTIYAMAGNDYIVDSWGNDTIYGGTGNDILNSSTGGGTPFDDVFYGGYGDDIFVAVDDGSDQGDDTFQGGIGTDSIYLTGIVAGPGAVAALGDWSLTTGASYTTNDDYIVFDSPDASGTITFFDGSTIVFDGVEKIHWNYGPDGLASTTANNVSGAMNTAIAMDLAATLTETDGSEFLMVIISHVPTGATLSAGVDNGDGSWTLTQAQLTGLTITPPTDFNNDVINLSVKYINSQEGGFGTAVTEVNSVTVTVGTPVTTLGSPEPVADSVTTITSAKTTVNVLANDIDPNNDALTVTNAVADNGTVIINADGTITYTSGGAYTGSDTITYTVSDGTTSVTQTVTVDVQADTFTTGSDAFDISAVSTGSSGYIEFTNTSGSAASITGLEVDFSNNTGDFTFLPLDGSGNVIDLQVEPGDTVRINADGSYSMNFDSSLSSDIVNSGNATTSSMTVLSNGNYVIVWLDDSTNPDTVRAQIRDNEGNDVGSELVLTNASDDIISAPAVTSLTGGGFVIGYTARDGDTNDSPYIQYFDNTGTSTSSAIEVSTVDANVGSDYQMALIGMSDGGVAVAYNGVSSSNIQAAVYDASGDVVMAATTLNGGNGTGLNIAELSNGDLVASFYLVSGDDAVTRTLTVPGGVQGTSYEIDPAVTNDISVDLAVLNNNNVAYAFVDGNDLYIEIRSSDTSSVVLGNTAVTSDTPNVHDPVILALSDGGFAVFWSEDSTPGIYGRLYDADGTARGDQVTIDTATATNTGLEVQAEQLSNGNIVVMFGDPTANAIYDIVLDSSDLSPATFTATGTTDNYLPWTDSSFQAGTDTVTIQEDSLAGVALNLTDEFNALTAGDSTTIIITVPTGAKFSAGTDNGNDTWTLASGEIAGLTYYPPSNSNTHTITLAATDPVTGAAIDADIVQTITVTPIADGVDLGVVDVATRTDTAVSLQIDADLIDAGETITTVTISGVPTGASLSAGSNNGDNTWSIDSSDLSSLTLTPPSADNTDFTLTVSVTTQDGGHTKTVTDTIAVTVDTTNVPTNLLYDYGQVVNSTIENTQTESKVAALSGGGYVVTWVDSAADGSGNGVYMQVFDNSGNPVGSQTLVNTTTTNQQQYPDIIGLTGGGFVIVWENDNAGDVDPYFQMFNSDGTKNGSETLIFDETDMVTDSLKVTANSDGGFSVGWEAADTVYLSTYNSSGTETLAKTSVQSNSDLVGQDMTTLNNGNIVQVWSDATGTNANNGILFEITDTSGSTITSRTSITDDTAASDPAVAVLTNNNFVITWIDVNGDVIYEILAQDGTGAVAEQTANTDSVAAKAEPQITALSGGGFIITWYDTGTQDGSGQGVYAQVFDASGNTVGSETLINFATNTNQDNVSIAQLSNGNIVFTFDDDKSGDTNITMMIYDSSLNAQQISEFVTVNEYNGGGGGVEITPLLGVDADGGETFTYAIAEGDTSIFEITGGDTLSVRAAGVTDYYIQDEHEVVISVTDSQGNVYYETLTVNVNAPTFDGTGKIFGTDGVNDFLLGTTGNDEMYGFDGDNIISAGTGTDTVYGMSGDDTISGGTGNDTLYGGAGTDLFIINSGDGDDSVYGGTSAGTDTILLYNLTGAPGVIGGAGTWSLTTSDSYSTVNGTIVFDSPDASGTIEYWDGTTTTFAGIEKIHYDTTASGLATFTVTNTESGTENNFGIDLDVAIVLNDTDGSETTVIEFSGIPLGSGLSAGTNNGDGTWNVDAADLTGLQFVPGVQENDEFVMTVTVTTVEEFTGATNTSTDTITVSLTDVATAASLDINDVITKVDTAVALNIDAALASNDDASMIIEIIGVPLDAVLSAGTTNNNGIWTLTKAELAGLTLTPGLGSTDSFSLTVRVITTDSDGASTATVMDTMDVVLTTSNPPTDITFGSTVIALSLQGDGTTYNTTAVQASLNSSGVLVPTVSVAALSATDADSSDSFTYRIVKGDTTMFQISNGNEISVTDETLIDYYQQSSYDLDIEVTDSQGNSYIETFTIQVEQPTFDATGKVVGSDTVDDVLNGTTSADEMYGFGGDDVIIGKAGNDTIYGMDGWDNISGGDGTDTIYGGSGNDTIFGDAGADTIYGGAGDDTISGGTGDDIIYGGVGNDTISGGTGADTIYFGAGEGNDVIDGGSETGVIDNIFLEDVTGGPSGSLAGEGTWVLEIDGGGTYTTAGDSKSLTFDSENASGTITYWDGSQVTFSNTEKITWEV